MVSQTRMAERVIESLEELKSLVGQEIAVTPYMPVTQERIDEFAETTGDRQWIHIDVKRAQEESPYGATIAHGFLTLSLLTRLLHEAVEMGWGRRLGVNYGLDRVRFPAPVRAGSNIRARVRLLDVQEIAGGLQLKWSITVECEGATKPSCVAEWLVRYYD